MTLTVQEYAAGIAKDIRAAGLWRLSEDPNFEDQYPHGKAKCCIPICPTVDYVDDLGGIHSDRLADELHAASGIQDRYWVDFEETHSEEEVLALLDRVAAS